MVGIVWYVNLGIAIAVVTVLWALPTDRRISEEQARRRSFLLPAIVVGALGAVVCGGVAGLIVAGILDGSAITVLGLIITMGGFLWLIVRATSMLRGEQG